LGIGLVSATPFFFSTLVLPGLFPKLFESARWTLRKEIVWNIGMFALMIAGFTLTALFFDIPNLKSHPLFGPGALALLPILLFNLLNYNNFLKTKIVKVFDSARHLLSDELRNSGMAVIKRFHIESENGKEIFNEEVKNIVLIQSASNYIKIFFRESTANAIRKQMIRQTLNNAESRLSEFPSIKRCHRCCLVNINQVSRLTGTSSNYMIEVEGLGFRIPVSRQKIAEFRNLFSKAKSESR
jgi:hypothetical protein